jgi:hypothetical protein
VTVIIPVPVVNFADASTGPPGVVVPGGVTNALDEPCAPTLSPNRAVIIRVSVKHEEDAFDMGCSFLATVTAETVTFSSLDMWASHEEVKLLAQYINVSQTPRDAVLNCWQVGR